MRPPAELLCFLLWTVCVAQDCQEPPPKKDIEILSGSWPDQIYPEGKQAIYKCRPGYRTLGTIMMVCKGGEWVSTNPNRICKKKPCGHPGDTAYGSFQLTKGSEFEYGARVVYTCNEGYQMLGEINFRDCEPEGWTNDIPTCEIVKCLPLTEPVNGRILRSDRELDDEYLYGQVMQFECNPGFRREGVKELHCSEDGRWSHEKPTCVEISCTLPEIQNGQPLARGTVFKENERLQYKCNSGFEYVERGDAVCTGNGWMPQPACEEVTCKPPYIPNGSFSPQRIKHRTQDKIRYTCKDGFYPPLQEATCTSTGWVPAPRCSMKPCDFPEIRHGSIYHKDYYKPYFPVSIGKYYSYYCDKGFIIPTSHSYWDYITCTAEGWKPAVPCVKRCDFNYLENGDYRTDRGIYEEGQSLKVRCYSGFSLPNGEDTVTCTENGWSPPLRCIRVKTCSKSELDIENGYLSQIDYKYPVNKQTEYKCKPGYITTNGRMSGTVTCLQSGWSAQPVCIRTDCVDLPSVEVARLVGQKKALYKSGEQLTYECPPTYLLNGSNTVTCVNGRWIGEPTCRGILTDLSELGTSSTLSQS